VIDEDILNPIRYGVCGIGYFPIPQEEFAKGDLRTNYLEIVGSGFLVRENIIITNRHVIDNLVKIKEKFPSDRFQIQFVYPNEKGYCATFARFRKASFLFKPQPDIGFIETIEPINVCKPLPIIENSSILRVSQEIGVVGYPYGTDLLIDTLKFKENDQRILNRLGPILHLGIISAIAPFEKAGSISQILIDVRSARGMSGGPVFDVNSGKTIGILYSGVTDLLENVIPIDRQKIINWLKLHDEGHKGNNVIKLDSF
jgi:S1-C subfamily serine protease